MIKVGFVAVMFLVVLGIIGPVLAVPFILDTSEAQSIPTATYQYKIKVEPDIYWAKAEYIVEEYSVEGGFVIVSNYYHAPIDSLWPTARNWQFYEKEVRLSYRNVRGIIRR